MQAPELPRKRRVPECVHARVLHRFVVTVIADVFNLECVIVRQLVLDLQAPLSVSRILQARRDGSEVWRRKIRIGGADRVQAAPRRIAVLKDSVQCRGLLR